MDYCIVEDTIKTILFTLGLIGLLMGVAYPPCLLMTFFFWVVVPIAWGFIMAGIDYEHYQ